MRLLSPPAHHTRSRSPEAPMQARDAPAEPLVMNLGDSVAIIKGELSE